MGTLPLLILILVVVAAAWLWSRRQVTARDRSTLADAKAEARRWVERLGGQIYTLDGAGGPAGADTAARQALADASERYNAAAAQLEPATSAAQCRLATQTALEGLYYVRAARTAMGLDPGPALPDLTGQHLAGRVTEDRRVTVDGQQYAASPLPGPDTPNYFPGGTVAGRPVPQGWYSRPWWQSALIGGAWGLGGALVFDTLLDGMVGRPAADLDAAAFDWGGASDAAHGDWAQGGSDWAATAGDVGGDWGSGFGDW